MTSKERVYAAIRHKKTDRVPRFIWVGSTVTDALAKGMHINPEDVNVEIGNDILQTWLSINGQMEKKAHQSETFVDEWGITWERQGLYNAVIINPLKDMDADKISKYQFPVPLAYERYKRLDYLINKYGKTHFIGADVSGTIFEPSYHLRGMENLLVDMITESDEATVLLDKICDFSISVAIECAKREVDWIWLGDDIGTQRGMIMSPDLWRHYIKPRMKKLIDAIKSIKPDMIIAYHSCGTVSPVIEDLIEIGINVLNPIQESALDMDQKAIKLKYGNLITMMCGLDTQQFMTEATTDQIQLKTEEKIIELSTNGGYIFAVSHTLQQDIPLENIVAMLDKLNTINN